MGTRQTLFALTAIAGLIAGAASVLGHGGATGVIAERMNGMMDMARSVKDLATYLEADSVNPDGFSKSISVIERHAGGTMLSLFPDGSLDHPSEASPRIWEDWNEFERLATNLERLAGELREAPVTVEPQSTTEPSSPSARNAVIWAALDEYALMGLPPRAPAKSAESVPASEPPATRTDIFLELTATCASCHEKFRRSGQ